MAERTVVPGWTIHTYEDAFEPWACGPQNVSVDVNKDDTVTIEHYVPSDSWGGGENRVTVTVPIRWLTEAIAETLAYRMRRVGANG